MQCADAADDERDQLPGRIDGVNTANVVPMDGELNARDEPHDTQDDAGVPYGAKAAMAKPTFSRS